MDSCSNPVSSTKTPKNRGSIFLASHKRAQSSSSTILSLFTSAKSLLHSKNSNEFLLNSTLEPSSNASPVNPELTLKERRPSSVVARLNEEVSILSGQLNQSNLAVSYYTSKTLKANEKVRTLQEIIESQKLQLKSFTAETSSLKHQIELLNLSKENDRKKIELEQESLRLSCEEKIQELVHEGKKEKISIENHFIEMITSLNHKFIEEVEFINKKFKEKIRRIKKFDKETRGYSEKESDVSTFFMPEGQSLLKISANSSPTPLGFLKKSVDSEELDLSLRALYGQMSEKHRQKPENLKIAAGKIFEICKKHDACVMKESFLMWADQELKGKTENFERCLGKVCFLKNSQVFKEIVKVQKIFTIRKRILRKWAVVRWRRKGFSLDWMRMGKFFNLIQFFVKRVVARKVFAWDAICKVCGEDGIRKKKILKKYLDFWQEFRFLGDQIVTEGFYKWKSYHSRNKLKGMKQFFNCCN